MIAKYLFTLPKIKNKKRMSLIRNNFTATDIDMS